MKCVTLNFIMVGGISLSLILGCKARNESSSATKDNSNLVVTEIGTVGNWVSMSSTGNQQNYVELQSTEAGLLTFEVSMDSAAQTGFQNPVKISVYDRPNQAIPIATGDLVPGQYPSWMAGSGVVEIKQPGSIYILVSHGGQMGTGDISTRLINSKVNPSRVVNYPGSYQSVESVVSDTVSLQIAGSRSLAKIGVSLSVYNASPEITNVSGVGQPNAKCPTCKAFLVLSDNGKDYEAPLTFFDNNVSGEATFQLEARTYDLKVRFEGVPAGSLVETYIDAYQFKNNGNNQPFVASAPMGMLELTLDQTNRKMAVHGGKKFGYLVTSDRETEVRIDLNLGVNRIVNQVKPNAVFPQKIKAIFGGPGGNYSKKVAEIELDTDWGNNFSGTLISDIGKGKYRIQFDDTDLDDSDILEMNGSMSVSLLSISDGGPDASTFNDLGSVTITPPNNYLVDLNVGSQPHNPVAVPLDLASKSLLEGFEKIRLEYHVRIPKGATRGANNRIDRGTIEACLGNTAEHWSDIMIHYYCQYGQARSCYTGTIRSKAMAIQADGSLDTPAKIAALQTIRLETWSECAATATSDGEWKWIVDNQAEVFQYIMNSQTFAFNDDQQQAVINKFYRIDDPSDKDECISKRPRRAIDPTNGTHCLPRKIYNPAMTSVGR